MRRRRRSWRSSQSVLFSPADRHRVYDPGAPQLPPYVLETGLPMLGICYGMQALTHALGGQGGRVGTARIRRSAGCAAREPAPCCQPGSIRSGCRTATGLKRCRRILSRWAARPIRPLPPWAILHRHLYGLQFHPEVHHTPGGADLLRRFVRRDLQAARSGPRPR